MTVTIDQDTFTRANQSGWGTASGGSTWVSNATAYTMSIASNRGVITGATGTFRALLGSASVSQIDLVVRWTPSTKFDFAGFVFGWNGSNNYCFFSVANGSALLDKVVGGSTTTVASNSSVSITGGLTYWAHLNITLNTVSVRVWQDGTTEPSTWLIQATDSVFSTHGQFGLHASISSLTTRSISWDSFTCTSTPQTYYIGPSGSDSNPGTQTSPFATFSYTTNLLTPGCVVNVLPGNYNEKPFLNVFGTSSNRIVFQSTSKWGAKIVVSSANLQCVQIPGNYIDFWGFDVTGDPNNTTEGIHVTGSFNTVRYNKVHDLPCELQTLGGGGITTGEGFYTSTGNVVDSNFIINIGDRAQDTNQEVHGVYSQDLNCVITNNIIINCSGSVVALSHGSSGSTVANNLGINCVVGFIVRTDTPPSPQQTNSNALVCNNILYTTAFFFQAIQERNFVTGGRYLKNIVYAPNCTPTYTIINGTLTGTITSNPLFVNFQIDGSGDYHTQTGSPCVDAGTSTGAPSVDYDGVNRPQGLGFDIGPYEHVISAIFPSVNRRTGLIPSISRRQS